MTLLKKIGLDVLKVIGIVTGLMPLIAPAITGATSNTGTVVVDKLTTAFNVIQTAEQMFTAASGPDAKTGSLKLKAATPYVAGLIQSVDLFSGKKPKNEALFTDALTRLTAALADIMNSFGA